MNTADKDIRLEIELATLEIKGKRYAKAEQLFLDLTKRYNTAATWCGLAIAKFGRLLDGITVEEVYYCFQKARDAEPSSAAHLELLVLQATNDVIVQLLETYRQSYHLHKDAKWNMIGSAVASGFLAMSATMDKEKSDLSRLAALSASAITYADYLKSKKSANDYKLLCEQINSLCHQLEAAAGQFVKIETAKLEEFKAKINQYSIQTVESLKSESQKKRESEQAKAEELKNTEEKRQSRIRSKIYDDEDHLFHKLRKLALQAHRTSNHKLALQASAHALALYDGDDELKRASQRSRSVLSKRFALLLALPYLICVILAGVALNAGKSNIGWVALATALPFIIVIGIVDDRRYKNALKTDPLHIAAKIPSKNRRVIFWAALALVMLSVVVYSKFGTVDPVRKAPVVEIEKKPESYGTPANDLSFTVDGAYETYNNSGYLDAIPQFRNVLKHDVNNIDALYGLGICLSQNCYDNGENCDEAIELMNRFSNDRNEHRNPHYYLALCYLSKGELGIAFGEIEQAKFSGQFERDALALRGAILYLKGEKEHGCQVMLAARNAQGSQTFNLERFLRESGCE